MPDQQSCMVNLLTWVMPGMQFLQEELCHGNNFSMEKRHHGRDLGFGKVDEDLWRGGPDYSIWQMAKHGEVETAQRIQFSVQTILGVLDLGLGKGRLAALVQEEPGRPFPVSKWKGTSLGHAVEDLMEAERCRRVSEPRS